jgi:hypothetical protein
VRGAPLTRAEQDRLALLSEYTLDNAHYYCETADITRPFPSAAPVAAPSWEFVWNNWLGASLREEGLGAMCPPLLQVGRGDRGAHHVAGISYCQRNSGADGPPCPTAG